MVRSDRTSAQESYCLTESIAPLESDLSMTAEMSTSQKAVSNGTLFLVACLLVSLSLRAQSKSAAPVREDLGNLHHPIETANPEAQRLFDEGLTLVYGFNHEEALRRFKRPAALDPKTAMP